MKVLVTGATGFIGSALCRSLCESGYQVTAFHRPTSVIRQIEDLPLRHIIGDLCDEYSVESAFAEKPEIVFHLGAQTASGKIRKRILDVNIGGTRRILQSALRNHVDRVIFLSSSFAMGIPEENHANQTKPALISEAHTWNFSPEKWPYAWSKYLAEKEVQLASAYGMDTVILNPCIVIGPGDHYRKTNSFIVKLKEHPPIINVDGGINLIHVQDVVEGLIHSVIHGARGERYILSGTNVSFQKLFLLMSEIQNFTSPKLALSNHFSRLLFQFKNGVKNPSNVGNLENDLFHFAGYYFFYESRKARIQLRLSPPRNLTESLKESWNWFKGIQ